MSNSIVLIAEDDADTRDVLRELLEPHGFEVIGAEDSILAYGLLSSVRPNVIIVDIMMPNVDGIGLIRWIRAKKEHIHTPIIAMTAYGEQHLKEAKDVGATATAKKPEDIPNLPAIVTRLLGKTKRIRNGNGQNAAPA